MKQFKIFSLKITIKVNHKMIYYRFEKHFGTTIDLGWCQIFFSKMKQYNLKISIIIFQQILIVRVTRNAMHGET